MSKAMYSYSST